MLCSCPVRAHRPIVSGVNFTLAASRISAASFSVIQSAGDAIGQSPLAFDPEAVDAFDFDPSDDFDDDPPSPPPSEDGDEALSDPFEDSLEAEAPSEALEPDSPDDPPSDPPEPEPEPPSPAAFETPGVDVARRSFFAQPDPLKWIAGVAKAFFSGPPPHNGHTVGSSEWTPRRTSDRWPQAAQS